MLREEDNLQRTNRAIPFSGTSVIRLCLHELIRGSESMHQNEGLDWVSKDSEDKCECGTFLLFHYIYKKECVLIMRFTSLSIRP